jgi:hypothetical protein
MDERMSFMSRFAAALRALGGVDEVALLKGHFKFTCYGPDGNELWRDVIDNTVVTVGKNIALDTLLAGSSYTVAGPYMGLISSTSYSSIVAADTMSSHSGWLEAGAANTPHYTAPRPTMVFSAASGGSKQTSSAASFPFTGGGTVKGGFVVLGSGAVGTIDSTAGTLLSAGLLAGGDRIVTNGDTLAVTWALSA